MRLRTPESFFLLQNGLLHSYPSLQDSLETEMVVVGGGVTGALISDALVEAGHEVVLLDRRDIGHGSTSATTALLQFETDEPFDKLAKKIGLEGATKVFGAGIRAIEEMGQLVRSKKLDCAFQHKKSIYFAHNRRAIKALQEECTLLDKSGFDVEWVSDEKLRITYHLEAPGAIFSRTAGSVDAYRMAHELIAYNVRKGMQVYDQTTIRDIDFKEKGLHRIMTEGGPEVRCRKIIFCSGFETLEWIPEKIARLYDTYVCISEQNIALPETCFDTLFWNTDDPYLYFRTTDDRRLLVGGLDTENTHAERRQKLKERKSDQLQKTIKKQFPQLAFTEDFTWAGTFGMTKYTLPYMGAHPKLPNTLFVLGFGGNGITFSFQGRGMILDMLAGKEHPLAPYYRFGR